MSTTGVFILEGPWLCTEGNAKERRLTYGEVFGCEP